MNPGFGGTVGGAVVGVPGFAGGWYTPYGVAGYPYSPYLSYPAVSPYGGFYGGYTGTVPYYRPYVPVPQTVNTMGFLGQAIGQSAFTRRGR